VLRPFWSSRSAASLFRISLISLWVPILEFLIDPVVLADTSNTGLQALLSLAATEVISGEFLAQINRQPGWSDAVRIGSIELKPPTPFSISDPSGLVDQGMRRLAPFLRRDGGSVVAPGVLSAPLPSPEELVR